MYTQEPLSMQCNRSDGFRFDGFEWEGSKITPVTLQIPVQSGKCENYNPFGVIPLEQGKCGFLGECIYWGKFLFCFLFSCSAVDAIYLIDKRDQRTFIELNSESVKDNWFNSSRAMEQLIMPILWYRRLWSIFTVTSFHIKCVMRKDHRFRWMLSDKFYPHC